MTGFDHLLGGFAVALSWKGLLYCFLGCLWGTIVGVLPGLGPLAGITLLLPLTFGLDPTIGIIMLTGIFYGAMYGGSTTSILVRIPGEAASVVTCIDGYEMARKGRAGPALMIAALGSFVGGTVSILGLMFIVPPLAKLMIAIGPSVQVVLILLALGVISMVSAGSRIKTAAMVAFGLVLGSVGLDKLTAVPRFTFGSADLTGGLSFAALAIGLFGLSEILLNLEKTETIKAIAPKLKELVPRWNDLRDSAPAVARGSAIGFIFGVVPGVSHVVASMYIGNVILLILNLPLVGIFVNLLRIPYAWLVPIILIISIIGVYSVNFSSGDIWIMVISGAVGYILRKFGYEMAPLLLALVLGDRLEENFRLALTMSGGSYATFVDSASVIVLSSALSVLLLVQALAWAFGYRKSFADQAEGA